MVTSGTLAAVTAAVSGSPRPPRRDGSWTLACRGRPGLRQRGPPHAWRARWPSPRWRATSPAGLGPLVKPPPAGRWRATAKLTGRQEPPRRGGTDQVNDRGEAVAVRDGADPATPPRARWRWQQGLNHRPQFLRDQSVNESGHSPESWHRQPRERNDV